MENPLYELWQKTYEGAERVMGSFYRWPDDASPQEHADRILGKFAVMKQAQHAYAWAIPDEEAIKVLVEHSPLVEIGAGRGYWASLVKAAGGDMVCYDRDPPNQSEKNIWCPPDGAKTPWQTVAKVEVPTFTEILLGGPERVLEHQDRTLFLCWPPMSEMAYEAVTQFTGDTVIFVGEGYGGCTADDAFFEHMQDNFDEDYRALPKWEGLNDYLSIFTKSTR